MAIKPNQPVEVFYKGRYRYATFMGHFDDNECFVEIKLPDDEQSKILRVETLSVRPEYLGIFIDNVKQFGKWLFSLRLQIHSKRLKL